MNQNRNTRRHPRHTTIVAYLALFVALGGTAVAAGSIAARDSVTSKSIRDDTVKSADVRDDAISGTDVNEASLGRVPFAEEATGAGLAEEAVIARSVPKESITTEEIRYNEIRSEDISDLAVKTGDLDFQSVGSKALQSPTAVVGAGVAVSAGNPAEAKVTCPNERQILNGGFAWQDEEENSIIYSAPSEGSPKDTWVVKGMVPSGSNTLYAWASCLPV